MSFKVEEQAAKILPPVYNTIAAVNCSTTVTVVDMTTLPLSGAMSNFSMQDRTPMGKYVRITADGGPIYFVTGSNFAQLNAIANTVIYSTINTTTGKVTVAGGELDRVPQDAWKDVMFYPANSATAANPVVPTGASYGTNSPVRYLALITASGNAIARLYQSSD